MAYKCKYKIIISKYLLMGIRLRVGSTLSDFGPPQKQGLLLFSFSPAAEAKYIHIYRYKG
jgi:hypothetical protein